MKFYKVLPDLSNEREMRMWHRALRSQWSAADIAWDKPRRVKSKKFQDDLGKILTPILMGEQAALYSVAALIQILGKRAEVAGQLYLTTWAVDEGRHTELFSRYYGRIDREPLTIRKFPSGYLFQGKIISDEPAEWLSGVLVSEVLAKLVMEEFLRLDLDPVLSEIADGVLIDEARHLGFNHVYLEDRFAGSFRESPDDAAAFARRLHAHLAGVLEMVPPIFAALKRETASLGIDAEKLHHDLSVEAAARLQKSIDAGAEAAARSEEAAGS